MISPYAGLSVYQWVERTRELILKHPLNSTELYAVVHQVWQDIFLSSIGSKPFHIGTDLFPRPQIMAYLLHELVPLELERRYPGYWRRDLQASEKDIVYIPDDTFSIEIKTSSSSRNIYGNRSYAQKGNVPKKEKSGYCLAVNFQKFAGSADAPKVTLVRFGWLDHEDWIGQKAATGQQSRLPADVEQYKLLELPL